MGDKLQGESEGGRAGIGIRGKGCKAGIAGQVLGVEVRDGGAGSREACGREGKGA